MRTLLWLLLVPATLLSTSLCGQELAPWHSNRDSTDVPRRHVQDIAAGKLEYRVVQGGTMDGRNCRSPQGVWTPLVQTWESNRSVRMENVGQSDVVNPWLVSGRRDFRSTSAIAAGAIEPGMSDKEKAIALWWQQVQYRFHYAGDNRELASPVKVFNLYGHNTCGNDSICLAGLWKEAGLKVAPARLVGHCVTQVFYDGGWHLFDGDMQSLYLLRDNETIAGEQDLVRDHDLIKRTHTQGILRPQGRAGDEWESSIYVFEGDVSGDRNADRASTMNMTLRPGEALVWRWGHTEPVKFLGSKEHKFAERICNGLWEYRPDFTKPIWRKGADSAEGIAAGEGGLEAEKGKIGQIVWTIRVPYVLVGGKIESEGTDVKFEISWDGKTWASADGDLDSFFPPEGTARYAYHLRCRLSDSARLRSLRIVNDLQMAPLALPEMGVGENEFTYSDESAGPRSVRITHAWVERSASAPPAAPPAAIWPSDRGEAEGTDVVFQWQPAADPDGDQIADYHFELSARADMKWPLSMSFAKLISRTSDAGKARFTLKAPGELNPDRPYYWHVRAKDERGVWGPWSKTWSFTPRGPSPPMNVAFEFDSERNLGTLRWAASLTGRKPVAYRIYASDEKGFSVSDEPFTVAAGVYDFRRQVSTKSPTQFTANFVVETQATELAVFGSGVELAGANKAFYRVVAVDEAGKRSGPSDYVAAPRPVIFTKPLTKAKRGTDYGYDVRAIRSFGDMRTRVVDGREVMNYWDSEQPRFRIEQGPSWLSIDETTGRLSGTPDAAGQSAVTVAVTLEQEQRTLDPGQLQWGLEKTLATTRKTTGTARQSFVIETALDEALDKVPGEAIDFRPVAGFLKLREEMKLGQVSGVDIDSRGHVYVIQRKSPPVLCFDSSGKLLRSWGTPLIGRDPDMQGAHGIRVDGDDFIWITDRARHLVRKFDPTGQLLLTLGTEGSPGTGPQQFNRPADVAFGPAGEIYVADGYGNSRVMKFDRAGKFLKTWGEKGKAPGQFDLPHTIAVGPDGRVYVGDRYNSRIQIFDAEGSLKESWQGFVPCGIAFDRGGNLFVADGVSKVLQLDGRGAIVKTWGTEAAELGLTPGQRSVPPIANPGGWRFVPHLMAADAAGNLYLADVPNQMLHKLERYRAVP